MNKIVVAHIRDSGGIFGAERVILTISKNLDKRFEVVLICLRSPDGKSDILKKRAEEIGVKVVSVDVKGKFDLAAINKIRDTLKQYRVNILHSHDFKSNLYGLLASRNLNIRRVLTAGGTTRDSLMKKAYMYVDETFTYRFYKKIIAVSEEIHERLMKKGITSPKIVTIENGIDPSLYDYELFEKEDPHPLPTEKRKSVFAVVGRLFPDKGHRFFLEAFRNVVEKHPDSIALIIGEGPSEEAIRKRIEELGLGGKVFLCGVRKDMPNVYRNIDCLVIPSLTEGLPYVLLEAMVYKVSVLATEVGGIPELIKNGETGFLVPPGNVESLEIGMKNFLADPEKAGEMAENGYNLVINKYSATRMAERVGGLYDSLMSGQPT